MAQALTSRAITLVKGGGPPHVPAPAAILRDLPATRLLDVESVWQGARTSLAAAVAVLGQQVEHGHWDWRRKVPTVVAGTHRIVAIECTDGMQGLMALAVLPRHSQLSPGENVLYVDYIESAPWNKMPGVPPRYRGVGTRLIAEAIRISQEDGFGGRVGLHSLVDAVAWYRDICLMTPLGADTSYYDLEYFEYAESVAAERLATWRV